MNLRQNSVWLILHFGAKVKETRGLGRSMTRRPAEMACQDRALVTFDNAKDVNAKRATLEAVIREWIGLM